MLEPLRAVRFLSRWIRSFRQAPHPNALGRAWQSTPWPPSAASRTPGSGEKAFRLCSASTKRRRKGHGRAANVSSTLRRAVPWTPAWSAISSIRLWTALRLVGGRTTLIGNTHEYAAICFPNGQEKVFVPHVLTPYDDECPQGTANLARPIQKGQRASPHSQAKL